MKGKYFKRVAAGILSAVMVVAFLPEATLSTSAADTAGVDMYRLYNKSTGEHFYTGSREERDGLYEAGWKYEGIGWVAPKTSSTPVFRLYSGKDHHYTTDASERDALVKIGWKYEGIGWYSADEKAVPLYKEYRNSLTGAHNYTTDKSEHDKLVSIGWRNEGIGWYGIDASSGSTTVLTSRQQELLEYLGSYGLMEGARMTYTEAKAGSLKECLPNLLFYTLTNSGTEPPLPGVSFDDEYASEAKVTNEAMEAYADILGSGIWDYSSGKFNLKSIIGNYYDNNPYISEEYSQGYGYVPEEEGYRCYLSDIGDAGYDTLSVDKRNDGKIVITYKYWSGWEDKGVYDISEIRTVTFEPTGKDSVVGIPYRVIDFGM